MKYTEAIAELEKILAELNSPDVDIDTLAVRVKRATELIEQCRARLREVQSELKVES